MTSQWRKSSRSSNSGGNCVEARVEMKQFQVRDSKLGDASPIFELDTEGFTSLLRAAQR